MERWKALDVDRTISDMWSLKSYLALQAVLQQRVRGAWLLRRR